MPLELRSGLLKQAPKRQYISAYGIFYEQKSKQYQGKDFKKKKITKIIREHWGKLSDDEKECYQKQFTKYENLYQSELIFYYGGSKQDIQILNQIHEIPEKPKKPQTPWSQYIAEKRKVHEQLYPAISY